MNPENSLLKELPANLKITEIVSKNLRLESLETPNVEFK